MAALSGGRLLLSGGVGIGSRLLALQAKRKSSPGRAHDLASELLLDDKRSLTGNAFEVCSHVWVDV